MIYHQSENSECGLVCLAYAASLLGAHLELTELRRKYQISSRGLTVRQLCEIATSLNIVARAVRCDLDELSLLKLPAVLHWNFNHFVVLERVIGRHVVVHDPAHGRVRLSLKDVNASFTGVAIELSPAPNFERRREKSPLGIMSWIKFSPAIYSGLAQVLVLSCVLQLYTIASPFYIQLAIDQAALKGDSDLLTTLAVGFGLFGLFNVGAGLIRSFAMQEIAGHLGWEMGLRLFRHLVRLPLQWFQRRRLADTISRFEAINPIRDLVSGALISSAIDGFLAVTTLAMMFLFSRPLAFCACAGTLFYIAVRLGGLPMSLRMSAEALTASIQETGKRIETIKAIQTIKVMAAEVAQEAQWSNRYADHIRKKMKSARYATILGSTLSVSDTLVTTAVIFIGAKAIIEGKMTVGILYAFMAYRAQFTAAIDNILEQAIQWKLSDVFSHRLADIVLSPREEGIDAVTSDTFEVAGNLEVDNIAFRYTPYEPFVFRNLSFKVQAGEFLAIVGPSGIGKSSLLKLICGLYKPAFGEIRLDNRPLAAWEPRGLRKQFGVVLQDDELLTGTIAENVAFFDDHIDMDRIWNALDAAGLKTEVLSMPMNAETFVGDMGGALSGGQKQRLLIARAIYRRPRFLLMDEATSHLDLENEVLINNNLRAMNITRIVIAHRIETVRNADKVLNMKTGQIEDVKYWCGADAHVVSDNRT